MPDRYLCRDCSKLVAATKNNRYRTHSDGDGEPCGQSSEPIPQDLLDTGPRDLKASLAGVPEPGQDFAPCPECGRNVKLTRLGYLEPHDETLRGGNRCPSSGTKFKTTADIPLPGETVPEGGVDRALRPRVTAQKEIEDAKPKGVPLKANASTEPAATTPPAGGAAAASEDVSPITEDETYRRNLIQQPMEVTEEILAGGSSPESPSTPDSSPTQGEGSSPSPTGTASEGPFRLGPKLSESISQPFSPYLQPVEYAGPEKPEPMGDLARDLATRVKETFYSYSNRKSADNRSAQTTLGPSEIGTPCDRRLAMALMGVPPVNPGGDGWAAFVGTMGHVGMGEIYTFADAGTGRYAVELPVRTGSDHVPRGTTDLLDRMTHTVVDWKFMGEYSLKKFRLEGPSDTYRIQAHVYGYGATCGGEKVKHVAIVGLPRAGGSLDDMHVWTEPYSRRVAEDALQRVEDIADQVEGSNTEAGLDVQAHAMRQARKFDVADDCRFCNYYLKGDKGMVRGCPGS